jgi:hypothetical protein
VVTEKVTLTDEDLAMIKEHAEGLDGQHISCCQFILVVNCLHNRKCTKRRKLTLDGVKEQIIMISLSTG